MDDNDKSIERVEEIIRFSDNDDDESEDEDGVDNGGSIWANTADIFNPAKRANFIQQTKQKPLTKPAKPS